MEVDSKDVENYTEQNLEFFVELLRVMFSYIFHPKRTEMKVDDKKNGLPKDKNLIEYDYVLEILQKKTDVLRRVIFL